MQNLCEIRLRQPFGTLSEQERHDLVEYLWRQLPQALVKYKEDVTTFTMDSVVVEGV